MQVFRLVESGHPDKIIAFDSLPERLLEGLEMREPTGLPRHWAAFLGKQKRYIKGSMEKMPDGTTKRIGEETTWGPYFYILDYKEINRDKYRWQEIGGFVRKTVDLKFRLMDKIEDMALPMAPDSASEMNLEPEDVTEKATIPIPVEFQELTPALVNPQGQEIPRTQSVPEPAQAKASPVAGKHTCKNGGRFGRYAKPGECGKCDALREEQLVKA